MVLSQHLLSTCYKWVDGNVIHRFLAVAPLVFFSNRLVEDRALSLRSVQWVQLVIFTNISTDMLQRSSHILYHVTGMSMCMFTNSRICKHAIDLMNIHMGIKLSIVVILFILVIFILLLFLCYLLLVRSSYQYLTRAYWSLIYPPNNHYLLFYSPKRQIRATYTVTAMSMIVTRHSPVIITKMIITKLSMEFMLVCPN